MCPDFSHSHSADEGAFKLASAEQSGCSHRRGADFSVVGAYPGGRQWDLLRGLPGERPQADRNIAGFLCRATIRFKRSAETSLEIPLKELTYDK